MFVKTEGRQMKIGTILFTYQRSGHTRRVLEALSENTLLPEKLYIFQDGMKESTNDYEWKKVNEIIQNVDWCETKVHISKANKGLARSVETGISQVLRECDAAIILEDDCVPCKGFMSFMISALNRYEENQQVYSVSGYAWDIDLLHMECDAYFNGRICSYGWGTWKDRWNQYEEDYRILSKIKKNKTANERLEIWGQDLKEMVIGNVIDRCDSWAVFWALKVIEKGGYCLSPYKSFIHNIGFDGSGTHGAKLQSDDEVFSYEWKDSFRLPQKVESSKECKEEFQFLFAGKHGEEKMKLYQKVLIQWIQFKQAGRIIKIPGKPRENIAVWGKGSICDCFLNEIQGQAVKYIIESRPSTEEYKGIPVISLKELPDNIKHIVVIPYFDLDIIKMKTGKIRKDIHLWGIDELLQ